MRKDVTKKARERFEDPAQDLDEADLRLLELQQELDAEEAAKEAEQAAREEEESALEAADEADLDESEPEGSPLTRAGKHLQEKKQALAKEAEDTLAEIAVGSLSNPKGVSDVAVTALSKRLPSLPSRDQARNVALGLAGVGVMTWMMWGTIGWIFGWIWTLIQLGILGGVGWAGYKIYGMLPESSKEETQTEEEELEEDLD